MKSKISKLAFLALASTFMFACSTSNDVVQNGFLQKRKYNKGWHVNKSKKIKDGKGSQQQEQSVARVETKTEEVKTVSVTKPQATIAQEYVAPQVAEKNVVKTEKTETTTMASVSKEAPQEKAVEMKAVDAEKIEAFTETKLQAETVKEEQANAPAPAPASGGSVPMIVLVLLAIIIPPIAVGLYTGWDTTPLLISILLTILFWVPGIVYALLVIFDVV